MIGARVDPVEGAVLSAEAQSSRVRDSAAVVMIRGRGADLEVYWVKRSDAVTHMPGFRAYVGGTLLKDDELLPIEGAPEGPERTMRACALREVFEETGVLIGVTHPGLDDVVGAARTQLLANEAPFSTLAREHGWTFRADELTYIGRWVTPPFALRRFDTWFFLSRVPEGQEPNIRVGELAEGEWIRPQEAIARWKRGQDAFAAPILYNLEALAGGEEGLLERMLRAPERAGETIRRIELKWGIVLHPARTRPLPPSTHTNVFLVGEREMALVDPGPDDPDEIDRLFAVVDLLERAGRRLTVVLLTHHHLDHVGGLDAVRSRYKVRVAAHAETGKHVKIDVALKDGEYVPLAPGPSGDWNLRAVHTPGHTRGHLCFYHARTRSLLSGDHVIGAPGTVIIDPPEGDMAAYVASLRKVLELHAETLFPGHGPPQGAANLRIQGLLDHRQQREQRVIAALSPEPQSIAALVERAYADTPRDLWPYAERSLLAHLIKLEGEGRAERVDQAWKSASL